MTQIFRILKQAGLIFVVLCFAAQIKAQEIAFSNPTALLANGLQTSGDQFHQLFSLGLKFTVVSNVVVTALGAYDATIGGSGSGFPSNVQVAIYSESSQSFVTPIVTFLGAAGSVTDSYRFQAISNIVLTPGPYMLVATGYGLASPDWNSVVAGISPSPLQFDNGNGALADVSSWYDSDPVGIMTPPAIDGGNGVLLAAGSFEFTVLEPVNTPISFTLDEPCKTSAGVYDTNGTLIRTLWSKVRYPAGTNSAMWNGFDDNGDIAQPGVYQIKLLQHNTEYVWDGAIGNSSAEVSGPTVHRGFWPMRDMAITGTNAFYVSAYNEGGYDFRNFLTTDPQHVRMAWYWIVNSSGAIASLPADTSDLNWRWVVADSHRVYFACSGTPYPATTNLVPNTFGGCVVACNVGDNSPAYFTNGVPITNVENSPLPSGIYVGTQPGLSGLSVQQNGNLLAAAVAPDNKVYFFDKLTGSAVGSFTVNAPGRLNFSPDGGSLWIISSNSVLCFTNLPASPTIAATIPNFSEPLDVAVCPTNANLILVADGGASQQVKAFDHLGNALWVYGLPGGYQANGVAVATNKFWFFDGEGDGTFICFAADGTYWVGDGANHRTMHFSGAGNYIEQIMYQPHSYVTCVDQNNPNRVFNQFLEFNVDYSKPLAQAWTLVNNWQANVDPAHISWDEGLREVTTFTNGRTYAMIDHNFTNSPTLQEVCELTGSQLRFTGLYPMVTNQGRWMSFGSDGSARATAFAEATWYESTLNGFDASNNPVWNPEYVICSAPNDSGDPIPYPGGVNYLRTTISSNNILIAFDASLSNGWHLGGVPVGGTNWLWKASPSVNTMSGTGDFEIGLGVLYPGNDVQALDRQVIFGYHGEFFRQFTANQGEAAQTMHFLDDGLFVGQFGQASPGHDIYEWALPGFAGNGVSPSLTRTTNGDYYLWVNDESNHGPQRWHFVNARNIREQTGAGALGNLILLTNPPCAFPTGVTGKNGNQSAEVSWLPVPGAASYNVYYSTLNGGPYSLLAGNTTNLYFIAGGLTNGQTYYFAVTAIIAGTEGIPSGQTVINPFDTTQNVLCAGSTTEGGQDITPVVEVSSSALAAGQASYIGSDQLTGLLNPRELDYYGCGNLQNESLGAQGYVIYDGADPDPFLTNVFAPFTITLGAGWNYTNNLDRQFQVDGVLGTADGLAAGPVGTIAIGVTDTNFHYLTVISPARFNNARQFVLRLVSTNNTSASFTVNESLGYSHMFQFLFRGNATLVADATGGGGGFVQALFLDHAPVISPTNQTSITTLTSSQNPAAFGSLVTFTATVTGASGVPTGTVAFDDGTNILSIATLNISGVATFSTAALSTNGSPHAIKALYSGDSSYAASSSSVLSQIITDQAAPSPPLLTGAMLLGNGAFQFSISNNPTASMTVLSTTNLFLPTSNWTILGAPSNIAPGLFQFTSPPTTNDRQRYYRIVQTQ